MSEPTGWGNEPTDKPAAETEDESVSEDAPQLYYTNLPEFVREFF